MPIKLTLNDSLAVCPGYSTQDSAGCDLVSVEDVVIHPGSRALVNTGISMAIPFGLVGMVCPRSGLALKQGITVVNAPGVIDSDYRGEIKVILGNTGTKTFSVNKGDRIAQLVILPFYQAQFTVVKDLDETERGEGGFGSTGLSLLAS